MRGERPSAQYLDVVSVSSRPGAPPTRVLPGPAGGCNGWLGIKIEYLFSFFFKHSLAPVLCVPSSWLSPAIHHVPWRRTQSLFNDHILAIFTWKKLLPRVAGRQH